MNNEEKSIEYHLEHIKKLKKQYEEEYKKQIDLEVKSIPSKDLDSFVEPKTVMKREQTAVEFFNDALDEILELYPRYPSEWMEIQKAFKEAKQMEKEQIEEAHKDGQHYANHFEVPHEKEAEQYYESKYGKDENKAENND